MYGYPDWGFSVRFPKLQGKCQGKTRKDRARPTLFLISVLFYVFFVLFYVFLCSMYCLFCAVLWIVCVYMCSELLPPGGYPIAVKYIISHHIWNSTCLGRHTAHHQEPKTALAARLWFCTRGRLLDVYLLDAVSVQQPHVQQPSTYAKPEAASAVLGSWWWAVCRPKHVELHINME